MSLKKGIDALTSLRFFAAFSVFIDHYVIRPYSVDWSLSLGYIAMTFFFTLSGFVLTYAYSDDFANSQITKLKFYVGRFARIWPLHILCLVIALPFVLTAFEENFRQTFFYLIVNMLLLQDIIPHSASIFNEPSWSISAEMFFYLCFPFLITLAVKKKNIFNFFLFGYLLVLLGIALFFSHKQTGLEHNISILNIHLSLAGLFYVSPPIRLLDFMMGIFLFFIYKRLIGVNLSVKNCSYIEIFLLISLGAAYCLHPFVPQLIQLDLLYLPSVSMLLIIFSLQKGVISKLLSNQKLIFLGEASFAFYMLQTPVKLLVGHSLNVNQVSLQFLHFIVLITLAIIVHKYFEYPCYRKIRIYFGIKQQINQTISTDDISFNMLPVEKNRS